MVKDVLCRLDISVKKLRGQCYEGAASMSRYRGGLAVRIQEEEPRVVYTHCYGHALNLACSDALKQCKLMGNSLSAIYEIINLIKKSPHRDAVFQNIKQKMQDQSPGIRTICPTRWTVHAEALQSVITNYGVLQQLWEESPDFVKEAEMRSRIQGVSVYMTSFDFMFGILLGQLLLRHSDNLSRTLQSPHMSAAEGQKLARMTLNPSGQKKTFCCFGQKLLKCPKTIE